MNLESLKQQAVQALGFDRLNEMQQQMLATATTVSDVLLLSPTGTGKTVAFLLPMIAYAQAAATEGANAPAEQVLIIVPGRELALQIAEVIQRLHCGLRAVCCYGGHDLRREQQMLAAAPAPTFIVGTPGRLKDHMERGNIHPAAITRLVLDEYDKSLELGFEEDMKAIVKQLSGLKQRLLTSATHAVPVAKYLGIERFVMQDFLPKTAEHTDDTSVPVALELRQVKSPIADKLETLLRLVCSLPADAQIIIFSNYRESSERIAHYLSEQGVANALYHGGMPQDLREKALIRFRGGSIRVLVSTDLAARGLDIPEVEHVVHYHLPASLEVYTHRNGRTARAGARGTAYLIVGPNEYLPEFIGSDIPYHRLPAQLTPFTPAPWRTLYIGRGKREKISRGDVLGFLVRCGGIEGQQIGRIDVQEHCAYAAVRAEVAQTLVDSLRGQKIKGEKTHYLIVDQKTV
jgi:superfamily II DNA/RNA helicase